MTDLAFGLDFGTTNSLPAVVENGEIRLLAGENDRPYPSVVWYRGGDIVIGSEARKHIESLSGGGASGFVRSPKMRLRRDGPVHVEGRMLDPVDIVSEVLRHIRREAEKRRDYRIERAVMTVPVDFGGSQRRALRMAARKAGIRVIRFVHEPAAALYAHIRGKPDFRLELERLENRAALVFDWGGGTLDLTVCRILGGMIMQVANHGNSGIGGDQFDERLRNFIRDKHARKPKIVDIAAREHPGAEAMLLTQSELAKIRLSKEDTARALGKDYIRGSGDECDLAVDITRAELEDLSSDLVGTGLGEIDRVLKQAGLDRLDIDLCLATGGMVNMPAIRDGLVERFGARAPKVSNQDSIIAEGAAWIAHDDLDIRLSKPLEVLVAGGPGRGSWLPMVDTDFHLPVENQVALAENRRFYCTDPRDGKAAFEFGKPRKVGAAQPEDERETLEVLTLPVDPTARPFLERLECQVQIDHDYIASATIRSDRNGESVSKEIHVLDFGLALPPTTAGSDGG